MQFNFICLKIAAVWPTNHEANHEMDANQWSSSSSNLKEG